MLPPKPPTPLPKIQAPTAAEVCAKSKPSPASQALLKPGQTPPEYLATLEQNQQSVDAVNFLAHGMPERESVWWACQSSRQVEGKLNPADKSALTAAESWVKNPTPQTQANAAAAAAQTDYTGPGAWAAQAAAWSQPTTPAPAIAAAAPKTAVPPPGLAAPAAAGSVMLASGLAKGPPMPPVPKPKLDAAALAAAKPTLPPPPKMPTVPSPPPIPEVDQAKLAPQVQPFLDLGKDVASGKNTWA